MRVLVCGSRNWTDTYIIHVLLEGLRSSNQRRFVHIGKPLVIIEGCAAGADWWAHTFESRYKDHIQHEHYPADWLNCAPECHEGHRKKRFNGEEYCPTAGHRRNQKMLDEGKPEIVLAFTNNLQESRGTKDMVARARKASLRVHVISGIVDFNV